MNERTNLPVVDRRTPRQRWGTCCPNDPECEHSFMEVEELARYMDTPLDFDAEQASITAGVRRLLRCESCGRGAVVVLDDGSAWCRPCDEAAASLDATDPPSSDETAP